MSTTNDRLRTLDGEPLDPASLTLGQVVESAYAHANGDIDDLDEFVAPGDVDFSRNTLDNLLRFLLSELVEIDDDCLTDTGDASRWSEARRRADQVLKEVQSVRDALHRFGPKE